MINWLINYWLWLAIPLSIFWGIYGLNYEKKKGTDAFLASDISTLEKKLSDLKEKEKNKKEKSEQNREPVEFWKKDWVEAAGIILSEFIGSLAGWICLCFLIIRYQDSCITLGVFDVFLGTVAVVGISGYSYRIVEALKKDQ